MGGGGGWTRGSVVQSLLDPLPPLPLATNDSSESALFFFFFPSSEEPLEEGRFFVFYKGNK